MKLPVVFLLFLFGFNILYAQNYFGGELRTIDSFTYGRFEVKYKVARGTSVLSTFFTYNDFEKCCSEWNEIDIEILGRYSDDIQTTTIVPRQFTYNSHTKLDFDPAEDFHEYGFEWTPDYVAWFVDGKEVYRQTGEHISTLVFGQKIMMNIWAAEWVPWVGEWNPELLPFFAKYDWVTYYDYTPGEGNYGTDNNFTFSWKDDFEEWDQEKWEKASHTFGGNRITFSPDNVVFKDGLMILCLTDADHLGYTDEVNPTIQWARLTDSTISVAFSEKVTELSISNSANYSIPGLKIKSVKPWDNLRGVEINVSEPDTAQAYNIVVFNLSDMADPVNTKLFDSASIIKATPLSFPVKINTGANFHYKDFLPDQVWGPTVEYGHMDGYENSYPAVDAANSEDDSLFKAQLEEVVHYNVRVPNGAYNIELQFAEVKYEEAGKRIFNVLIEDSTVIENLDVFAQAGINSALTYNFENIRVDDGILTFYFTNWTQHPVINAIIINPVATSIADKDIISPLPTKLKQNYPNPFNPLTKIEFYLAENANVQIDIFNTAGQLIKNLTTQKMVKGQHAVTFNGSSLASGVYYYRLTVAGSKDVFSETRKMLLIK
ncbi:MAG: family 16 glycosylhydrolase [Calditrichae bacterium]|nr:family 16 glycosylhydrolase [Calditrichia bacterium]